MRGFGVALVLALASCAAPPPASKPAAAPVSDIRRLGEAFGAVKASFVTPVDDGVLVASCTSGMRQYVGKLFPPLDLSDVGSREGASAFEQIATVLAAAKQRRPGLEDRPLVDACLTTMLANLDKLSAYLGSEEFRELQVGTETAGIGIELKIESGFPVVVSAIEGTPASRSDLAPGDLIVRIDGFPTEGLALREVVQRMRGRPSSSLTLDLRRTGGPELRRVFTREIIRVQSVISRTTSEGYAHIRITQFQMYTLDNIAHALKSAHGDGAKPVPGIILDLRNNTGGLLNAAVGVTAVFLPQTTLVVETKGRTADASRRFHAGPEDYLRTGARDPFKGLPDSLKSVPVVVIVNARSASGAEIVAAALQDHRRAKVVGERTFGAGTIQTILPMGNATAIKLTTAKFYRPNGEGIEGNPLVPDELISPAEAARPMGSADDPALSKARALLSR